MNWVYVFLGGGLGSVLRYLLSVLVKSRYSAYLPLATLLANVLSCILMGLIVNMIYQRPAETSALKYLLIIGLCGGFSTFSTFSYETLTLMKEGNIAWAIANVLLNTSLCIAVIYFLNPKL